MFYLKLYVRHAFSTKCPVEFPVNHFVLLQQNTRSGAFTCRRSIHEMSVTEAHRDVPGMRRPLEKQQYCTSRILGYEATDRRPCENIILTRQDFVGRLILFQGRKITRLSVSALLVLTSR